MQKYIQNVVQKILNTTDNLDTTCIVLPNKRASVFVKNEFKNKLNSFQFLPQIISIEEFITNVSKIDKVDNLILLFKFYKVYLEHTKKSKIETFEQFSNWATILIKDFNEIDSYLIDQENIFSYLKDINRIENWFNDNNPKTELTKNYVRFFEKIEHYYKAFYKHLLEQNIGYQGLQYREAFKQIDTLIKNDTTYHFIGFNALNTSEEEIIKTLLNNNKAKIYFDLDSTIENQNISASNFIKKYKANWSYFKSNPFIENTNEFENLKNINVIGVPKNVSQIKYANEIIKEQKKEDIAFVLANENLLTATINSIPKNIKDINITMGMPLKNIVYADLFYLWIKLHRNKKKIGENKKFYYKDVLAILNHSTIKNEETNFVINRIKTNNHIFITFNELQKILKTKIVKLLFTNWTDTTNAIQLVLQLIQHLKTNNDNHFKIEYLNRFEQIFNQLNTLNLNYEYIDSIEGFLNIYKQILENETLSFKGSALKGLQIMGMLETRVLEFETVIITSVNEGFLPSGKTNKSFIPFDVKQEKGIPTYQEKDSIFSYHFFRLIARAKNVFILYNTETDDFGSGEQSRFITQLELLKEQLPKLTINKTIVSPKIKNEHIDLKRIKKDQNIIDALYKSNKKGFSPTALTNYIYNPIRFYKQKVLHIYQLDEIEETIAANTLGTVIHQVLEDFYKPYKNKYLKLDNVMAMKSNIANSVEKVFKKEYQNGDITKGKNLLTFEVAKQFVTNFINQEIQLLKQGVQLKIIDLEIDLTTYINIDALNEPLKLFGQADRIDELDGVIRIIDYKTGKAEQKNLNLNTKTQNNWELITQDYKYSKAFQVLLYAYMYTKMNTLNLNNIKLESGIISFKNLKAGFMKVNKSNITSDDLIAFETELKMLLSEIFNPEIDFIENENLPFK